MARWVTFYIYFLRPDRQGPTLGPIHALTKQAPLSHIYRFAKIQLFACFTSQRTLFSHEAKNGRRHGQLPLSTHRHAASSALFQYDRGQKTDCWRGSTTIVKASDSTKGNSRMKPAIPQKAGAEKTPEGTANKRSALRSPTQHAATSYAVRCDGRCSALRQSVRAAQNIRQADERGILLGATTARSCFANSVQAETGIRASLPGCKHHHFQYFQSNRLSALRSTFLSSLEKKLMPVRASTLSTVTA